MKHSKEAVWTRFELGLLWIFSGFLSSGFGLLVGQNKQFEDSEKLVMGVLLPFSDNLYTKLIQKRKIFQSNNKKSSTI